MWLVDIEAVWEPLPIDGLRGTELALRLLERTQVLLGDGSHWRDDALATESSGKPCNPLSERAAFYNLSGAAARARWEMREDLADAEISPSHMRQVMNALFTVGREARGEMGGWRYVCAVLDGMRSALEEYSKAQKKDAGLQQEAA